MARKDHPWLNLAPRWIARFHMHLTLYSQSEERRRMMALFRACDKERQCLLQPMEACQLMMALTAVSKIGGDMAEVGAFQGVSAKLLALTAPHRTLHVFDTFEGLPAPCQRDSKGFRQGQYHATEKGVREYLAGMNACVYRGVFPENAAAVEGRTFAFVHLDADLYQSTKASLEFFYPRVAGGGIIVAHDFAPRHEGVYQAFQEFFERKPEPVIELAANQGMVVKLG
jgi:predicted O-methyltransferase YrrM